MISHSAPPLLLLLPLLCSFLIASSVAVNFTCTTTEKCRSMIGYVAPNATTVSSIQSLFQVESLESLLAANSWPVSDLKRSVPSGSTVRIPIPCACSNGIGISDGKPVYTVKKGDDLDSIARKHFREFVTYQEIAAVAANNITDPTRIFPDQRIQIPLPCSCDEVDGTKVVHYALVVANGNSVEKIADEFRTTTATLLSLNNKQLTDPKQLKAGQILDVPLKACNYEINNTESLERSLLVANGSYALTANNCVQCSCNLDDLQLQCKAAQGANVSNWSQCPAMRCSGDLPLGSPLSSSVTNCSRTVCAYNGFTSSRILTALTNQSTCATPPSANAAERVGGRKIWGRLYFSSVFGVLSFITFHLL